MFKRAYKKGVREITLEGKNRIMKMLLTPKAPKKNKNVVEFNAIALRKAKIVYNFGISECNRVKTV